jgi:TIR domain/Domain of unknown function (DUF4352)
LAFMAHDVFISYASENRSAAEAACAALEAQGISCWIPPRDVLLSEDEIEAILAAIDASSVVVLCLSSAANASKLVTQQAARAFNKKIPVVPLRIEDVEPSDALRLFFGTREPVDGYVPPLEDNPIALVTAVRSLLTKTATPAAGVLSVPKAPYKEIAPFPRSRTGRTAAPRSAKAVGVVAVIIIIIAVVAVGLLGYMFVQSNIGNLLPVQLGSESPISFPSSSAQSPRLAISAQYAGELTNVQGFKPESGMKFVRIYATMSNVNAKDRYITPYDFKLKGTNGNVYSLEGSSFFAPNAMQSTNTQPGDKVAGNMVFDVPQDLVPQSLIYQDIWDTVSCNVQS